LGIWSMCVTETEKFFPCGTTHVYRKSGSWSSKITSKDVFQSPKLEITEVATFGRLFLLWD
jgi:hypothetical protein